MAKIKIKTPQGWKAMLAVHFTTVKANFKLLLEVFFLMFVINTNTF